MLALPVLVFCTLVLPAQQLPELMKDINPTGSSNPDEITILSSSSLFFRAYHPESGVELYHGSGAVGDIKLVKDISPGERSSYPHNLTPFKGKLYFFADDMWPDLWVSDGTGPGTKKVYDWPPTGPNGLDRLMRNVDDKLLFFIGGNSQSGSLWISDGTQEGTKKIHELNPYNYYYAPFDDFEVVDALSFNGKYLFVLDDGSHGYELWASDGTTEGTEMLKDICDDDAYRPSDLSIINNQLFFTHYNSNNGFEVYRTDGTKEGTELAFEIEGGSGSTSPEFMRASNGWLWFAYYDDDEDEMTLARANAFGYEIVKRFTRDEAPRSFTDLGLKTIFRMVDNSGGLALWETEGFGVSTNPYKYLSFTDHKCIGCPLIRDGGTLYFTAQTDDYGNELWKTDGTAFGTVQVIDLYTGPESSNPKNLTPNGAGVFFVADDGRHGRELWRSNVGTLGLGEPMEMQQVLIYPNPSEGVVSIEALEDIVGLQLFDYAGKKCLERQIVRGKEFSLDIHEIGSGSYILVLQTALGHNLRTKLHIK